MKAIIPCAGLGTRLRPHTLTHPKPLLHVAGKPILAHILDELVANGVRQVVLVIGHHGEQLIAYVRRHYALDVHFVEQTEPLGNGHAVYVAREYLTDEEPALIVFGDTIVRAHLPELLGHRESVAGVREVADPRRFGVAVLDDDGYVRQLVEKPEEPVSRLAVVGLYLIQRPARLREALERMVRERRMARGEYWLADALQLMLDAGERMRPFPIDHWYDCGTVEALLLANRELLDLDAPPVPVLSDAVVLPPSAVSPGARLSRCVVGPYASIAEGAEVVGAVVRDSIVHPEAVIEDAVVTGAVIGERARVIGRASRLNVGDHTQVAL